MTGPMPEAWRAAARQTPAWSSPPVASRVSAIAATVSAHPLSRSACRSVRSPSARTARSCRSSHSRSGSGSASRTWLSPSGAGPAARQPDLQGRVVAAGGPVAVGARMRRDAPAVRVGQPGPRTRAARRRPSRPACSGPAAYRCLPSTAATPVLVGLRPLPRDHVEPRVRQGQQRLAVPARTGRPRARPRGSAPCRPDPGTVRAACRRTPERSTRWAPARNGLRLTAPTRASTPPFSCPEYGSRNAYSNP